MATTSTSLNASQVIVSAAPTGKDSNNNEAQAAAQEANAYWAFIKAKFEAAKAWADSVIARLGDS